MSIIEAMAAGIPVVASNVGGVSHLVQDGVTGQMVPPGEPGPLADALKEVLSSPAKADEMGRKAKEIARQRFDAAYIAQCYLALYREVADARKAPSRRNSLQGEGEG